jgi:hypothetical protein
MISVKLARLRSPGLALALAGLMFAGAEAAPAGAGTTSPEPGGKQFVSGAPLAQMFSTFCLKAFPDGAAVDAALQAKSEAPLNADQAKTYLPDGPGRGWLVRTPEALFAVTVADPPSPTCTVRQMTPDGVRDIAALMGAIRAHVAAIKGTLVTVAPETATPPDGPEIRYFGYGVLGPDGSPVEQFGVYLSDYHGKVSEPWTGFVGHGSGVEVRFTRTILAS